MATINPLGGVQSIQLPFRPPVAIGEGTVVQVAHGLFAEVVSARMERRHGAWGLYLQVRPIDTAEILTGSGGFAVDVFDLSSEEFVA